jgi:hypothetical protein
MSDRGFALLALFVAIVGLVWMASLVPSVNLLEQRVEALYVSQSATDGHIITLATRIADIDGRATFERRRVDDLFADLDARLRERSSARKVVGGPYVRMFDR